VLGTKERQFAPLVNVSLDQLVPADHFYRQVDRSLDLSFVRDLVRDLYAPDGRPSVDPVVFFRLQLVMFFEGIRSERHLLRVAADRLGVRWYLGYDLDEPLPDHSSMTRIRDRYGVEVFRRFFEAIVEQCQQAGLVWGKELYFDATKVQANASLDSVGPRFAVEAHLGALFPPGATATDSAADGRPSGAEGTDPIALPTPLSEAERAELAAANEQRHDWIAQDGQQNRAVGRRNYRRIADFEASATDPDASPMHTRNGLDLGYHAHYVVDGGKKRIIVGVLVTPAEVMENQPMRDLLWRAQFRWQVRPRQVTGDTKYGTLDNIVAIEQAGIRAYVPLPDFDIRTPFYGPSLFRYDAERDTYVCPQQQELAFIKRSHTEQVTVYRAKAGVCNACPVKAKCTTSTGGRQVQRGYGEEYLERVQGYQETAAYQKAIRKRKVWVEPLFAEAKDWHGLRRFRLRRLRKVNTEALVTATGQNLKRLVAKRGWGRRPFPTGAASSAPGTPTPSRRLQLTRRPEA
jgi:transposase